MINVNYTCCIEQTPKDNYFCYYSFVSFASLLLIVSIKCFHNRTCNFINYYSTPSLISQKRKLVSNTKEPNNNKKNIFL